MIRNFQRLYVGEDREDVINDTLYCISLMRHYGAPSRLLDFTYSKDVATYFGLEDAFDTPPTRKDEKPDYEANRSLAIWCVDADYLKSRIKKIYPTLYQNSLKPRKDDNKRNDKTFVDLYMANAGDFVHSDNPVKLHQRLDIQHGVFLCPGNVAKSFMQNLKNLYDGENKEWIFKFRCELSPVELRDALEDFRHKTITRQSLLPGPDGFAESMKYKLTLFYDVYESRRKSGATYPFSNKPQKPKPPKKAVKP